MMTLSKGHVFLIPSPFVASWFQEKIYFKLFAPEVCGDIPVAELHCTDLQRTAPPAGNIGTFSY